MDNRRGAERRRVLKGGHVIFSDGRSSITCIARNLSDTGALLRLETIIGIPDRFVLVLNDGTKFPCVVKWRTGSELGVEFTD